MLERQDFTEEVPGDFRLGVKVRLFNHNLDAALKETGKPRYQVCKELGLNSTYLYQYLSFKRYPTEKWKLKICIYLGKTPDHLFPEHLAEYQLKKQPEPLALTAEDWQQLGLLRDPDDPVELVTREELKVLVGEILGTLNEREAQVLTLRYGLEDGRTRTFEEVALEIGPAKESLHRNHPAYRHLAVIPDHITRERVRQIEAKALRKLRHPARSEQLRPYLH